MTRRILFTVTAALVAFGAGAGSARQVAPPSTLELRALGRTLYLNHCASCHGASARGDGPVADSLRVRPPDLTQFARRNGGVFPSAQATRIIDGRDVGAHGSVEMPVWGNAFRATASEPDAARHRIEAIVHYLESIQERTGHEER
jgi:mono/diheme cytochrome c family protein